MSMVLDLKILRQRWIGGGEGEGEGEGKGTGMGNGRKGVLRGNDKSRPVLCSAWKKGFQLKQKQGI